MLSSLQSSAQKPTDTHPPPSMLLWKFFFLPFFVFLHARFPLRGQKTQRDRQVSAEVVMSHSWEHFRFVAGFRCWKKRSCTLCLLCCLCCVFTVNSDNSPSPVTQTLRKQDRKKEHVKEKYYLFLYSRASKQAPDHQTHLSLWWSWF